MVGTRSTGCTEYCSNPVCANGQLNYTVTSFSSTGADYYSPPQPGGSGGVAATSYASSRNQVTTPVQSPEQECKESWLCNGWEKCRNEQQTRTCEDWNKCGTEKLKPPTKRACEHESEKESTLGEESTSEKRTLSADSRLLSESNPTVNEHSANAFRTGIGAITVLIGIMIYIFYRKRKK
jgi:hypothetical protein